MQVSVYNNKGKEVKAVELPEEIFGLGWNADLVHQVAVAMQANRRPNVAHTKDRSEVRGGGRKPWRQKGTGRARHGSIRSPIWVGGGTTFGPRSDKDFTKKINKKMKSKALFTVLSKKNEDGEILFIERLNFNAPNTKQAKVILEALGQETGKDVFSKRENTACILIPEPDQNIIKSFNNIGNVKVEEVRNINPLLLLENKNIVFVNPDAALEVLNSKYQRFRRGGLSSAKKSADAFVK